MVERDVVKSTTGDASAGLLSTEPVMEAGGLAVLGMPVVTIVFSVPLE